MATKKKVEVETEVVETPTVDETLCSTCNGTGRDVTSVDIAPCPTCLGTGLTA